MASGRYDAADGCGHVPGIPVDRDHRSRFVMTRVAGSPCPPVWRHEQTTEIDPQRPFGSCVPTAAMPAVAVHDVRTLDSRSQAHYRHPGGNDL